MCNKNNRSLGNFHNEEPLKNLLNTKRRITTNLSEISAISRTRCRRFFFSRNKIRFSVNLYYNVRIIITIWSANVFYVFPTSEKLWEYFAKQKINLHFLWNYSLANMTHIKKLHITKNCHEKKNNCVSPKTFQNMTLWNKEKKKQFDEKKSFLWALTE